MAAVAFSATTVVFGGGPLLALARGGAKLAFLLLGPAVGIALFVLGVPDRAAIWVATWFMVAIYDSLVSRNLSIWSAGLTATAITTGALVTVFGLVCVKQGLNPIAVLSIEIDHFIALISKQGAQVPFERDAVLRVWPSALVLTTAVTLWLAVLAEKGMRRMAGLPRQGHVETARGFKVPDFLVWPSILFLAGSFLAKKYPLVEVVCQNGLNVVALLYFFQGMAIVAMGMDRLRAGPFFRMFSYVLLVGYLALGVSALGFADFWLNLRSRFSKKTHEIV